EALVDGEPLVGVWYDRTKEYEARRARQDYGPGDFATPYEVSLSPLPILADRSPEEQRAWYRQMAEDIEIQTRARLNKERRNAMGSKKVLRQRPHRRPAKIKRSPAPLCHCASMETWIEFRDSYRWFASLYREASRRLRRGEKDVEFPENCFIPALGFNSLSPAPS
ncbi:MAG: hypothetical protein JXR96_30685, partial [Deltaproteobacteria bacterium]|nr:hypothetical protein [Deltaproteobacteria bacterium]